MAAVYGLMCALAKRVDSDDDLAERLVDFVVKPLSLETQTAQRPQHVSWRLDVQKSSFKRMEKMWHHFHTIRLLHASQQRWFKSMKNGKNTRTCCEWLLTSVNYEHPLFESWRISSA